jgi:hypothetical protein
MCDDRRLQRLVGLLALPVHARIGDLARGTGLAGLKDRAEAIGGRIIQHSPPGAERFRKTVPLGQAAHLHPRRVRTTHSSSR